MTARRKVRCRSIQFFTVVVNVLQNVNVNDRIELLASQRSQGTRIFSDSSCFSTMLAIRDNPARGPPSGCTGCERASTKRHPSAALRIRGPARFRDRRKRGHAEIIEVPEEDQRAAFTSPPGEPT